MARKPNQRPKRLIVEMTPQLIQEIDDYRWTHRIPSRAAAIRLLIEQGLKHQPKAK